MNIVDFFAEFISHNLIFDDREGTIRGGKNGRFIYARLRKTCRVDTSRECAVCKQPTASPYYSFELSGAYVTFCHSTHRGETVMFIRKVRLDGWKSIKLLRPTSLRVKEISKEVENLSPERLKTYKVIR